MDKKNLMPQAAQPVNRITTGQLPAELAELSEEALSQPGVGAAGGAAVLPAYWHDCVGDTYQVSCVSRVWDGHSGGYERFCSYDGEDAE